MYKYYKNGYYVSDKGKIKRVRKGKEVNVYLKINKNDPRSPSAPV